MALSDDGGAREQLGAAVDDLDFVFKGSCVGNGHRNSVYVAPASLVRSSYLS